MFQLAWLVIVLLLAPIIGCVGSPAAGDAFEDGGVRDQSTLAASHRDGPVKTYPWVSTYLGANGCGNDVSGPRETIRIPAYPAKRFTGDAAGRLYLVGQSQALYVQGDVVSPLVDQGITAGDWERVTLPAPLTSAVFGEVHTVAAESRQRVYLASTSGIAVIDGSWLRWLAGATASSDRAHVDGVGEAARFEVIFDLALAEDGSLIVADGGHLRRVAGDTVSTIAGKEGTASTNYPKDGPALEATIALATEVLWQPARILFYDKGYLRALRDGQVTTLGGIYIPNENLNVPARKDGPLADAVFCRPRDFVGVGDDVYFIDDDPKLAKPRVLRRIRKGVVETIGAIVLGAARDGPIDDARFDNFPALTAAGGRLFAYDNTTCRLREIELAP